MHVIRQAAVLGHPISHSRSPALHRAAYAQLGSDITYRAIDVDRENLWSFMQQVGLEPNWVGLSVTMPLKIAMVAELDEVIGVAADLGVVNTVTFEAGPQGIRRVGSNTDVRGIVRALEYAGAPAAPDAVILGGGATSAAAVAALRELGCDSAAVYLRDVTRATEPLKAAAAVGLSLSVHPLSKAATAMSNASVVISTLPAGAADFLGEDLSRAGSGSPGVLLDVAYDPWPSTLAQAWSAGGGTVVPGLEMLLYQAVEQVAAFTRLGECMDTAVIDVMCDSVGLPRRVL